jgi:hypothetical protein
VFIPKTGLLSVSDIRLMRWHDLPSAYRLAGRGSSFDTQFRLTAGAESLRRSLFANGKRTHSYILKQAPHAAGMGMLRYPAEGHHARLTYLAPDLAGDGDDTLWLALLDGLVKMAGKRGAVNLIAEVGEESEALEVFREGCFGIYARQVIWVREPSPVGEPEMALRLAHAADETAISSLYRALVPSLIRQVEPPPSAAGVCYLLERDAIPYGLVTIKRGKRGAFVEPYLHPEARSDTQAFINRALTLASAQRLPVYCRLRGFMSWLGAPLAESGFKPLVSEAVMVRHTAVRVQLQTPKTVSEVVLPSLPLSKCYSGTGGADDDSLFDGMANPGG